MDEGKMENFIEGKVKEAIQINNAELLQNISSMINQISDKDKPQINNVYKNAMPSFKRKSNENQFIQNSNVLEKLGEAQHYLEGQRINDAKQSVIEGKN